ncbi:class 3 adenylate cyclase [Flavobacterium sp. 270]|uniref:adenylate/guanylate cyclase domain-containing protein n=1 Tax=Flavobacterium sp. 270 TaxID=2512114 RepID=UPI001066ED30|nr:adenylate/guanylate cyclase domain-containing protein [Flavobacterium sp. 270]TDW51701.1 class 3 adenylate cyclase [Flavobacterium sp. 270]
MKTLSTYLFFLVFIINGASLKIEAQTKLPSTENTTHHPENKQTADSILNVGEKRQNAGKFLEAMVLFEKSLKIYQSLKDQKGIGNSFNKIATTYYYQGDYLKALSYYTKCKETYEKVHFKKGISSALNNMGAVYYYLGNYPKALEFYNQAIKIQKKIGDKKIIAASTQNIGGIYVDIKDYANAMLYSKKANAIYTELKDSIGISHNLNGAGKIYMMQKQYAKAYDFFNQALNIADKIGDKQKKIEVLYNLGELFTIQGNFTKSLSYYNLCLETSQKINSLQYVGSTQIAIGNLLNKLGQSANAIKKCKTGLDIANTLGAVSLKKDACKCLYDSYKTEGNTNLALAFYEKSNAYKDSLQSEETSNKILNMEFQKALLMDSIAYVTKSHNIELKHKEEVQNKEKQRNIIIISLGFIMLIAIALWNRLNYVRRSRKELTIEKDRSEKLLLNILPEEIAEELKEKGFVNARDFNLVSILFTDFKSFTQTAEKMSPQNLVEEINVCFKAFDNISDKYNIEKIKTIGDSYMAAGGFPNPDHNSLKNIVFAALEMQEFMMERKVSNIAADIPVFEMRLGIHAGPIVAGIVGVKKFQYDVWGDTVNTASRIESNGMVEKVNISESLYNLIKDEDCFVFEYRGNIYAKGKGEIKMYFVEKNDFSHTKKSILIEHTYI